MRKSCRHYQASFLYALFFLFLEIYLNQDSDVKPRAYPQSGNKRARKNS